MKNSDVEVWIDVIICMVVILGIALASIMFTNKLAEESERLMNKSTEYSERSMNRE